MTIVVYHNPSCSKSRAVLRIVRDAGFDPVVVRYADTGWTAPQLMTLFAAAGLEPRDALRKPRSDAEALDLTDLALSDADVIAHMVAHPAMVERPFVVSPRGIALCRPPERVLDLLDRWPAGPYALENGTQIIDANGDRAT